VRIVCFTHAGAAAAVYRPWALQLDARIEVLAVQLPGRGDRMGETPIESVAKLVEHVLPEVAALDDRPLVLFGHSMGAMLAFETAVALAAAGVQSVTRLFVSARRPFDIPDLWPPIGHLHDEEFLEQLERRYGPIPPEVRNEPDVVSLFLPIMKADIRALESHQSGSQPGRVPFPIHAWGGRSDPTTPVAHLEAWAQRTSASHSVKLFDGGHFYIDSGRSAVLREIEGLLLGNRLKHAV